MISSVASQQSQPVLRPRSLVKRAIAGLLAIAILTATFAWLLHSSIDADAGTPGAASSARAEPGAPSSALR